MSDIREGDIVTDLDGDRAEVVEAKHGNTDAKGWFRCRYLTGATKGRASWQMGRCLRKTHTPRGEKGEG